MTSRIVFFLFAFILICSGPQPVFAAQETTKTDIIRMSKAGLSAETILTFLYVNEVRLQLTAEDLAALAEAEVAEDVITALIEFGNPSPQTPPLYSSGPNYPLRGMYASGFYVSSYYDPWYYPLWFYHDYSFGPVVYLGGHNRFSHTTGIHHDLGHGSSLHQLRESHGANHHGVGQHRRSAHRGSSIRSVHAGRGHRNAGHGRTYGSHSGRSHSRDHSGSRHNSHRGGSHGSGHSGGHSGH